MFCHLPHTVLRTSEDAISNNILELGRDAVDGFYFQIRLFITSVSEYVAFLQFQDMSGRGLATRGSCLGMH